MIICDHKIKAQAFYRSALFVGAGKVYKQDLSTIVCIIVIKKIIKGVLYIRLS